MPEQLLDARSVVSLSLLPEEVMATSDRGERSRAATYAGAAVVLETLTEEGVRPAAIAATELALDEQIHRRFTRYFLGAIALEESVELKRPDGITLATAVSRAKEGDIEAESLVDINVATAAAEGVFKDSHISRITKSIGADGQIQQFGLDLHQVHYNSYALRPDRDDRLKQFTLAEALNGYREQAYLEAGLLDEYFMLVPSCVPEGMPEKMLGHEGEGFFTGSMTYTLQATTKEGEQIVTETAFRRGTAAEAEAPYETRQAERYDLRAIGMIYEALGYDAPKTALEFLQRPLLLKKSEFPDGVVDVLRRCDIAADMVQSKVVDRSQAAYANIRLESSLKEASLADMKSAIKRDLLAAAGTFITHEDANALLWDLVRKHGVRNALTNYFVDPAVFGAKAAPVLSDARVAYERGDMLLSNQLLSQAVEVATVAGCGGGSCGIKELSRSELGVAEALLEVKSGEKVAKDTERPCPECGQKTIVYAWTETNVKKACTNKECGAKTGVPKKSLFALAG